MKRRALFILLLLVAGAIVNVAVAWGCVRFDIDLGRTYVLVSEWFRDSQGNVTGVGSVPFLDNAGLPLRAFESDGHEWYMRPIWPGFAINTVFYAGILWMLFAGPFALRRRSRRRRGLCVKCGYDLRGSVDANACPECGTAGSSERVA